MRRSAPWRRPSPAAGQAAGVWLRQTGFSWPPTSRRSPKVAATCAARTARHRANDAPDQHVFRLVVTVATTAGPLPATIPRPNIFDVHPASRGTRTHHSDAVASQARWLVVGSSGASGVRRDATRATHWPPTLGRRPALRSRSLVAVADRARLYRPRGSRVPLA